MPFFVLRFSSNQKQTDELKCALAHHPNGTPLCCGHVIYTPAVSKVGSVYWLENEFATLERINRVRSLEGVAEFEELEDVSVTIHDQCWVWEDTYIDSVLLPHL